MSQIKSPIDIYRRLPQTNCRECGFPSCFAFATAVLKGERQVTACPTLKPEDARQIVSLVATLPDIDTVRSGLVGDLRSKMRGIDLASSAERWVRGSRRGSSWSGVSAGTSSLMRPGTSRQSAIPTAAWSSAARLHRPQQGDKTNRYLGPFPGAAGRQSARPALSPPG